MIASRTLPEEFRKWNKKFGAPFGKQFSLWGLKSLLPKRFHLKLAGPFAIQTNNETRTFEYPWAFFATPIIPGLRVLEIGCGLGGFQFVLDKCGCRVINIDPGLDAKGKGWLCDTATMAKLNHLFGTSVELRNTTMKNANLKSQSLDRIFSISVLEHLIDEEIEEVMSIAFSCLKPGGVFIATIDLFLNITPFTSRKNNTFGKNINVKQLVEIAPFEFVQGNRNELNGYPEFDPDEIQSNLEQYLYGGYPALSQCIVLRKPNNSL